MLLKFRKLISVFSAIIFSSVFFGITAEAIGYFVKVIMVGDYNCGKTSVFDAYTGFQRDVRLHTRNMFLRQKTIDYSGNTFVLKLWDTAGEERYHSVVSAFFRGSDIACIVVNLKKLAKNGFNLSILNSTIRRWCNQIWENAPNCRIILVGNKMDKLGVFESGDANRALQNAIQDIQTYSNHYASCLIVSARNPDDVKNKLDQHIKNALNNIAIGSLSNVDREPQVRIVEDFEDETYPEDVWHTDIPDGTDCSGNQKYKSDYISERKTRQVHKGWHLEEF